MSETKDAGAPLRLAGVTLSATAVLAGLLVTTTVLGGSSRPGPVHVGLYGLYWLVMLVTALGATPFGLAKRGRGLMILLAGATVWALLQLVPLPPGLRLSLFGGAEIAEGFALVGAAVPAMPISLAPGRSLVALCGLVVPVGMFWLAAGLGFRALADAVRWATMGLACASALLGMVQRFLGGADLYFYDIVHDGFGTGVFANANHQAIFLLAGLLLASSGYRRGRHRPVIILVSLLTICGLAASGSALGYVLAGPTLATCALIAAERSGNWQLGALGAGLAIAVAAAVFALPPLAEAGVLTGLASDTTRPGIWTATLRLIRDALPFGSGLGTFPVVYPLYDQREAVDNVFVNHAQSDVLEWIAETGLAGALILIAAVAGLVRWTAAALRSSGTGAAIKKAAAAALWLFLAASCVDYPLRTPAIAALAAACAAVLAVPADRSRRSARRSKAASAGPIQSDPKRRVL